MLDNATNDLKVALGYYNLPCVTIKLNIFFIVLNNTKCGFLEGRPLIQIYRIPIIG